MRKITLSFGLLLMVHGANAQIVALNPQALGGWTLVGADQAALGQSTVLTLPAGAQVARSFPLGDVTVTAASKPTFGDNAEDWPTVELGAATLVFARNGDKGQLLLVIGDQAPVALDLSIRLDVNGRSVEPVAISLSYSAGTMTLSANDQTLRLPASFENEASANVILSAGSMHAWTLDSMQVAVTGKAVFDSSGNAGANAGSSSNGDKASQGSTTSPGGGLQSSVGGSANGVMASSAEKSPAASSRGTTGLEIYTPPSVRLGRTDAVRTALSNQKAK
jgi:hypothetical protein